jgi:hypothetical protein
MDTACYQTHVRGLDLAPAPRISLCWGRMKSSNAGFVTAKEIVRG